MRIISLAFTTTPFSNVKFASEQKGEVEERELIRCLEMTRAMKVQKISSGERKRYKLVLSREKPSCSYPAPYI